MNFPPRLSLPNFAAAMAWRAGYWTGRAEVWLAASKSARYVEPLRRAFLQDARIDAREARYWRGRINERDAA